MRIAFFGSSLVSAYWNGAATYYRGLIKALHRRGHHITFYEPDAFGRQQNRDIEDPTWAEVVVYQANMDASERAIACAKRDDLIVKASGVGVLDDCLEEALLSLKSERNQFVFWDVDAPATIESVQSGKNTRFGMLLSHFDAVFTYGGGEPVVEAYVGLGAKKCVPVYNALDPETHYRVSSDSRFASDLAFLGNRLPDREARVEEFFLKPAALMPTAQFVLGGAGWADKPMPANIRYCDHVYTRDHNAFNSTPKAVLNVARDSMARFGFSPATRVFEAAGAGACIITDAWKGVELFLEPSAEILVAESGEEVAELLSSLNSNRAREIGDAACRRILAQHTYAHRAAQVEAVLEGAYSKPVGAML